MVEDDDDDDDDVGLPAMDVEMAVANVALALDGIPYDVSAVVYMANRNPDTVS